MRKLFLPIIFIGAASFFIYQNHRVKAQTPVTSSQINSPTFVSSESLGSQTNLLLFRALLAGASISSNLTTILVFGDSKSANAPTANANNWTAQVTAELQSLYGDGGVGFISTEGSVSGSSFTATGTWNGIATGPFQTSTNAFNEVKQGTTGSTYAVTFGGEDSVDIFYYNITGQTGTSCNLVVSGTGGSTQNVGANANNVPQVATFTGLSLNVNHTLTITSVDGNCAIFGAFLRNSTGGVTLFNVARSAARSDAFSSANNLSWMSQVTGRAVILIELGENDGGVNTPAQTTTNITSILTQNNSLTVPLPVIFIIPSATQTDTGQALIYSAIKSLAQSNGYPWISIYDRWVSYTVANTAGLCADTACHPSLIGMLDWASAVISFINPLYSNSARQAFYPSIGQFNGAFSSGIHEGAQGNNTRYLIDGYNPGFTIKNFNTPGTTFTMQGLTNGQGNITSAAGVLVNGLNIASSVAFASLGTPSNGTILYCTDCTIANPCASGGTGAIAKRLNGVWVCN